MYVCMVKRGTIDMGNVKLHSNLHDKWITVEFEEWRISQASTFLEHTLSLAVSVIIAFRLRHTVRSS